MDPLTETTTSAAHASRRTGSRALALVGELMIIAGVVLGLYVVWELFYTDVQAGREQQQVLDSLPWAQDVQQVQAITAPDSTADPNAVQILPAESHFDPASAPVMDQPSFTTTFATLYVPRWGPDYVKPISEGTDRVAVLDRLGIGHYTGTGMPGALGNFAISAHRTTYAKPFARINELKVGDALVVQTKDAWYVYKVTRHEIVLPTQVEVIAPVPGKPGAAPDNHYITLTSCHPRFSASHRYVVHGVLEYWAPTGVGIPPELVQGASS